MERLREMILRVARSQAPVHISGESGTGKELVARMIHGSGPRAEGPFVPVNCGAIPSELMESEFFGHKRGSFTGAVADKIGLFPSAEGGTLFLDEVADLPLHMQVKLLRVIQEKTVRPIGEQREAPIDVRILSATHKNLAELVDAGEIPRRPLLPHQRDRTARAAAARARRRHSGPGRRHRAPAVAPPGHRAADAFAGGAGVLQNFPFPGNVRELENMLERALALCNEGRIDVADLQLRAVPRPESAPPLSPDAIAQLRGAGPRPPTPARRPRCARRSARGRGARRHHQGAGSRRVTTRPRPPRRWA